MLVFHDYDICRNSDRCRNIRWNSDGCRSCEAVPCFYLWHTLFEFFLTVIISDKISVTARNILVFISMNHFFTLEIAWISQNCTSWCGFVATDDYHPSGRPQRPNDKAKWWEVFVPRARFIHVSLTPWGSVGLDPILQYIAFRTYSTW